MIAAIKIRNYKGIHKTPWLDLEPFHVLVGPNGSGKSTFLDAIQFVKDCLNLGPLAAVESRAPEFRDLTFRRQGGPIEIDLLLNLSDHANPSPNTLHYRLVISTSDQVGVAVVEELLQFHDPKLKSSRDKRILGKTATGNDFYRRESGAYTDSFQFGPAKLALSLTPPDLQRYPTGNAAKRTGRGARRHIAEQPPVQPCDAAMQCASSK